MSGTRADQHSNSALAGVLVMAVLAGTMMTAVVVHHGVKAPQLSEVRAVQTLAPAAPTTPVVIHQEQPSAAPAHRARQQSLTVNRLPASTLSQPTPGTGRTSTRPPGDQ